MRTNQIMQGLRMPTERIRHAERARRLEALARREQAVARCYRAGWQAMQAERARDQRRQRIMRHAIMAVMAIMAAGMFLGAVLPA